MKLTGSLAKWLIVLGSLALSSCAIVPPASSPSSASASNLSPRVVPVDLTGTNHLFVQVRVNGSKPLWFMLDSGAESLSVDARRAQALGLKLTGQSIGIGAGENSYQVTFARNVVLKLAGVELAKQTIAVVNYDFFEPRIGRSIDGILGYPLFSRYTVEIDYAARVIRLYDPQSYRYSGPGESLPLTMIRNQPLVKAKIALPGYAPVEGNLLVDTGAGSIAAILNKPFVERYKLLNQLQKAGQLSPLGLGGESKLLLGRAQSFQIGRFRLESPVIGFFQDSKGFGASTNIDGIIGSELLRRFKVIFDHAHQRLILEPNNHFAEPFEVSMSGLGLLAEGADFKIFRIIQIGAGSPAAETGLRIGDVVTAIDGKPAAEFTLDQIEQMFKQEGREYLLSVKRGEEKIDFKIKLRRLI